MSMEEKHEGFSSKIGYVLSAAGSAVGLGNIWRFPYLAAKHGGGIFLLTYLILVLTFGYALLISENCIGRMTRKGPVGAFRDFCSGRRCFIGDIRIGGWINALVPLIIVPYYCVIGGWVTKYLVLLCTTPVTQFNSPEISADCFTGFITSTWEPIGYFIAFVAILAIVIAAGVEKGVERFNKILMPLLILIILVVCGYCCSMEGASEGLAYYLKPDFSKFSYMTVVAAMGQLFFSLSIAMGIMITYGSYMRREDDLVSSVNHVEIFDTGVAFLAGLMIIPAVVVFGGPSAAESAGPGLVFITMPQVFNSLGPIAGRAIGILFFILVLFAAATSAISLLETNVQSIGQELKLTRQKSIVFSLIEVVIIGVITILGYSVFSNFHPLPGKDILDTLDFISNNVMMPIAAIFTTILVTAVIGLEKMAENIKGTKTWYREWIYQFCMCIVVIPCLLIVLLNAIGVLN